MKPIPICIYGGTGVFGRHMVEELLNSSVPFHITVASRDEAKFRKYFKGPNGRLVFKKSNLRDLPSVNATLANQKMAILAAGPFKDFTTEIVKIAAKRGVHYLDICDWPPYYLGVQSLEDEIKNAGIVCLCGLSSLPGISVPLFCMIQEEFDHIEAIQIGLFIGNKNQKGLGAMTSVLEAPVSELKVTPFNYPEPIGPCPSFPMVSPDFAAFSTFTAFEKLSVCVGFEWSWARAGYSLLRRLSKGSRIFPIKRLLSLLSPTINFMNFIGTERGCVSVVVKGFKQGKKKTMRTSLIGHEKGQRMAIFPCVLAAEAIARGECKARGFVGLHQWMNPEDLVQNMVQRGFEYKKERL